ncbi:MULTISPECIES: porin [Delftia]|uniref:porin n=1 Tax=Delftia TaxID=80865 RepID=UPI0009286FD2|nr:MULTISPECIES: porin [Delftia]MXN31349.1 porin [Delftia sp. CH05]OJX24815.1 MAG: porin [Delftia sp. 67-8]QFS68563.1 porin [Delftia tsuruhatensis]
MGTFFASSSSLALAQSSVTIFGVVDVGVTVAKSGSNRLNALNSSQGKTSLLGLRGTEDLGGGNRAQLWLEGGLNPDVGSGGSSGSLGFERRSTIGLSNNSWGEIRLGRDYTPSYNIFTAFAGPDTTTGVQANLFQTIRQTAYNAASQSGVVDRTRISNAVGYFLPSDLGGIYGQFSVSFGDENASGSGASKARRYIGGNLGYRSGPLNVGIGYGRIDGTAAVASPSAIAATSDLEDLVLGASYNFGSFLLNGGYNSLKWEPVNGATSGKVDGFYLGATIPMGPGSLRVKYASAKFSGNASALTRSGGKADKYSIGYVYDFSKRTSLYAGLARVNNKNGASVGLIGGPAGVANAGSTGVDLGISHSF